MFRVQRGGPKLIEYWRMKQEDMQNMTWIVGFQGGLLVLRSQVPSAIMAHALRFGDWGFEFRGLVWRPGHGS